ncbi:MAG: hypothetical protein FJX84_04285 [Bacteroidetes bacterium]|nr:hypothetical protein [Bacteroidota bacterium]
MLGKRKKEVQVRDHEFEFLTTIVRDYPAKVILAWAKSIDGEGKFTLWLSENGYPELAMGTYAIYLKDEARTWLMKNGFPHLMAMINAAEGNKKAQAWLMANKLELYFHLAMAIEDEKLSWKWIQMNCGIELFILAKSIKKIKDQIEENHNDIHSYGKDY